MKYIFHILIILFLTIVTQVGGVIYLISIAIWHKSKPRRRLKRLVTFITLYLLASFIVIPRVAKQFGREPIQNSSLIQPHHWFYILGNRNYVKPEVNDVLKNVAAHMSDMRPGVKLIYLDANFPFIDGFPLLPHLSHNDGKKLDVTFIYSHPELDDPNLKPSRSGYGVYSEAHPGELDQCSACVAAGHSQYDMTKYVSFGRPHSGLKLNEELTAELSQAIVKDPIVSRLFIEPHLKERLKLHYEKVRFHGCHAVRHDDHIHFQIE